MSRIDLKKNTLIKDSRCVKKRERKKNDGEYKVHVVGIKPDEVPSYDYRGGLFYVGLCSV